jgi:TRAP-type C4-dicarboxylate transport system permease small subunit
VGLVVLSAAQVLLRTLWGTAIDWADGALQNATVLIGLLGAAVATSEGRHLNIDLLRTRLRGRAGHATRALVGLFALGICALLASGGWTTFASSLEPWLANIPPGWSFARTLSREISDGLIPTWLTQLMFPLGFGLIGFHFALRAVRDGASTISGKPWETPLSETTVGESEERP